MKLTTKQIKKMIREEVSNVLLAENLYRSNLKIINQKTFNEPDAWEQETNQYFTMLENGDFEEFYMAIYDDLPMLAKMLDMSEYLDEVRFGGLTAQQFLGSIGNMEDSGQAGKLVRDYINSRPGVPTVRMIKRRFETVELSRGEAGQSMYTYSEVAQFLKKDPVLSGYLGIANAEVHQEPYLVLTMDEDNLENNIEYIRDLWHGESYQPSSKDKSTMISQVASNSKLTKYSTIHRTTGMVELLLGLNLKS